MYLYENGVLDIFKEEMDCTFYRGVVLSDMRNLKYKSYGVASLDKGVATGFALELVEDVRCVNILLTIDSKDCSVIINMRRVFEFYNSTEGFECFIEGEKEYFVIFDNCSYNVLES